jgi:putative hydrolase of the HAD superfamily
MPIECVAFDADGVVIHPWRFRHYLEENHNITPSMTRGFFDGVFAECLVGKASLKSVLPSYLRAWDWPGTVEDFIELWLEVENAPDEKLISKISDLRRDGYLCCLATSQETNRADYMAGQMGFNEIFDELFFSCHIGYHKPERGFYEYIQSALRLSGSQILFWDDSEKNVAAAREIGWYAETYKGFADFEARMARLLNYK